MALSELVPGCGLEHVSVTGLSEDSRTVVAGDAFVAVRGQTSDGHLHIGEAVRRGAAAILCERAPADTCVPVVEVSQLSLRRGEIARRFCADPSAELHCVGVTGTNGKTSIAHFLAQLTGLLGGRCGYLGTIGWGFLEALEPARLTTDDAITLQKHLRVLCEGGADAVAMEVSSHALSQGRVDEIAFDGAVFSNLSRDHLDYHDSFEAYGEAKARLFAWDGLTWAVVNVDDAFGAALTQRLAPDVRLISYGRGGEVGWSDLRFSPDGIAGRWRTPWGDADFQLALAAEFSVANLAAAMASACLVGYSFADVAQAANSVSGVPGRMEFFRTAGRPTVVVDYAHTPDALVQALAAARQHAAGRVICVFGCGGDRDVGKRPQMALAAERAADEIWLTSDNPRSEDPLQILRDMERGLSGRVPAHRCVDRSDAVAQALDAAEDRDLIVVAGRGHEAFQEIGGQRVPLNDRDVVAGLLGVNA